MKQAKRTIVILSLALASCRGPMYAPTVTPQTISMRMLATTTAYPLLQDLAAGYSRSGVLLALNSASAGWQTVYEQVLVGEIPFALTTYLPPTGDLWVAPLGYDGIAIIAHAKVNVPWLTFDDLRLIFQGRVTSWAEVGGPDLPITVVSREAGDDTRLSFESLVMKDRRTTLAARQVLSSQSMVDTVASTEGAVGYVSMRQVNNRVRVIPVAVSEQDSPQTATPETVSAETYPLRVPLLIIGLQPPSVESPYYDWFSWMQSEAGQEVIGRHYARLKMN